MSDLSAFWKSAHSYATKRGFERDAEDFAQEATLIRSTNEVVRIDWIFANYLRKHYGRPGTRSGNERQSRTLRALSLDAPIDSADANSASLHEFIGDTRNTPDREFESRESTDFIKYFKGRNKQIVDAMIDGENQTDIATQLLISPSRLSQLSKRLKRVIQILHLVRPQDKEWVISNVI